MTPNLILVLMEFTRNTRWERVWKIWIPQQHQITWQSTIPLPWLESRFQNSQSPHHLIGCRSVWPFLRLPRKSILIRLTIIVASQTISTMYVHTISVIRWKLWIYSTDIKHYPDHRQQLYNEKNIHVTYIWIYLTYIRNLPNYILLKVTYTFFIHVYCIKEIIRPLFIFAPWFCPRCQWAKLRLGKFKYFK